MLRRGVHHLGLASPDYEGTVDFYTNAMGWEIVWQEQMFAPDGSEQMRHAIFDTGDGCLVAFMCSVPGSKMLPETWSADINSGLGLIGAAYHFAFWMNSEKELEDRQAELRSRGVEVSDVLDHEFAKSIYLRDPINGLLLEYSVTTREFTEDDKVLKPRFQPGYTDHDPESLKRNFRIMAGQEIDELDFKKMSAVFASESQPEPVTGRA